VTKDSIINYLHTIKNDRALLQKILLLDLNGGKNPVLTIVKRFARENTNDLGESLDITTSTMILIEFKKYLFLVASKLQNDTEGKYKRIINGEVVYTSPFPAPYML
jgi:hypothetical protein